MRSPHLRFSQFKTLRAGTVHRATGPRCATVPKLVLIGQTIQENITIFDVLRWRPSAILDLFLRVFGAPTKSICWSLLQNLVIRFDNMQLLIFYVLGLKMPVCAPPKWGVLGDLTPKMWCSKLITSKSVH